MSRTPPFRSRPNLHLTLTPLAGSPVPSLQSTPNTTPYSTTKDSSFHFAGLKRPPTPSSPAQSARKPSSSAYTSYMICRPSRVLSTRGLLLIAVCFGLILWWSNGGREDIEVVRLRSSGLKKNLFAPEITKGLQFFPASNPKIHVRHIVDTLPWTSDVLSQVLVCWKVDSNTKPAPKGRNVSW